MRFEFATAGRILFGAGCVEAAPAAAREMGKHALLVTGRTLGRTAEIAALFERAGIACRSFPVSGEPSVETARQGAAHALQEGCDLVVALGGGSAIDAGKAIAALAANRGDPLDYLEVVGRGQPLLKPSLPCIAIPTTAGTGSEVTRNAVLVSPAHGVKASLRSPHLLPRVAVVDPALTLDLPPEITASTGLDALTQLIEPFVSVRANVMTDLFAREGVRLVAAALRQAYYDGADLKARTGMAMASLLGGLCLANAGLGAVHGFAAPVGGMFPAPHGAVCAALLPCVMEANIRALRERAPEGEALRRYGEIARILTGEPVPEAGVEWVRETCEMLKIPRLGAWGVRSEHIPDLVQRASQASSMKGNPLPLTPEELTRILEWAI